jgi:hypothetical protein
VGLTVEADIQKTISDERALALFKTIALAKPNTEIRITKTRLTRKQYYSRMSVLMRSGLVKRKNGRYALTAFGKVIYDVQITIGKVISNYYWKLKAIDSLEAADGELSKDERTKVLDTLIDSAKIKEVILARIR